MKGRNKMTVKELLDTLDNPDMVLWLTGPDGNRVYNGTKNSVLRYPAYLNCEVKKTHLMYGGLDLTLRQLPSGNVSPVANPEGYVPPKKTYVKLPPIDEYLIDNGVSPNLIHMQGGKRYVIAFKEVEELVRRWYNENHHHNPHLIIITDPISNLPAIDITDM